MATFQITGPDGRKYRVTGENAEGALQALQQHIGSQESRVDPATNQPPGVPEFVPVGVEGYDPQTGEVTREPRSRLASAAHGAADVGTFGFGDELASYLGSAISGRPRDEVISEMRGMQKQAQKDNPGSYLAGQVGGALAQGSGLVGAGLSPTAAAVRAGWRLPGVAAAGGVEGAALGALHGAGAGESAEDRLSGAGRGAAFGGLMGAAAPVVVAGLSSAARRAISPFRTSPERTMAANTLRREGVDLTAGQATGSNRLRYAEGEIGGQRAADLMERQGEQFTSAALRRAGIDAKRATPDVIDDAFNTIGQKFDDLAARNQLVPDQKTILDLRSVYNEYGQLVPESARAPIVQNITDDIVQAFKRGPMSGASYQSLRSRLDRAARSSARDPELANTLRGIRAVLDDGMERSIAQNNPAQLGAWREARNQYRNMLVLEKAATGAGENAALGLISPSALRNATVTGQGRRAFARGQGDFAELSRAGEAIMKPLPNSGTASRLSARNIGTGVTSLLGAGAGATTGNPMLAMGGMLAGAALPGAVGRTMMSGPVQRYLSNQLASGQMSPQIQGILDALLVGQTSAAAPRLSAP